MRTYLIGRSSFADIVIADDSVAPRHAELVVTDDGQFFLTDCATGSGTWHAVKPVGGRVDNDTLDWQPLRQGFVRPDEPLRFGRHRCSVEELIKPIAASRSLPQGFALTGQEDEADQTGRKKGRVERDPITGQIVRKRV